MKLHSVLIVDDNPDDRYLLRRLLRRAKLAEHVFEAENGQEALAFFTDRAAQERRFGEHFPPMVVFLDINMPLIGGFEFLERFKELRAAQGYTSTVIMMFSSSERPEEHERASAYSFVKGFITKLPNGADDLRAQVAQALAQG